MTAKSHDYMLIMGSTEMEDIGAKTVGEENKGQESSSNKKITIKKRRVYYFIRILGCVKSDGGVSAEEPAPGGGGGAGFDVEAGCNGRVHLPTHLVVMVNGIVGSAQNWRYAAKQFVKAYPSDVLVHCSESNSSLLTFDGVDVMGKRLADEVISVVDGHPNLQKISFIGHSLGGLIARYAVAQLYQCDLVKRPCEEKGICDLDERKKSDVEEEKRGNIAGLEPVNFITIATPHLGSRGHKQVPMFCGFYTMENAASRASWLLGRTGKHLFLRDCDDGKPPLLLRMSSDSEDLKFISSLKLFQKRVAYSNARFDHIVGWSSSSLRRRNELPKRRSFLKNVKYPHIVNEEKPNTANPQEEVHSEAIVARGRTSDMEETMIRGLTRLGWERVDVNFSGSIQRFFAHNTIQVKTRCINYAGADVIQHMIDNFHL